MLVVMQEGATETQVERVIEKLVMMGFTVHKSTGVTHTVLGGVGPQEDFDPLEFEVLDGVKECHRIVSPYKLANKRFKPNGTEITVRGVRIGGPEVVVMAGPCSIENRDQIEISAEIVAKAGAKGIRGGAFKPRSSPYSFQGLGEQGLKMIRAAADRHDLFVVSEVMDRSQIGLLSEYSDILQVGARNMQNLSLIHI
jgi:3-deoxy-7-phosphoheptulonate synthase